MNSPSNVASLSGDETIVAQLFDKEVSYVHSELFDKPKANFSEYPLDIEPVWTWANALLGEFQAVDSMSAELNLLNREQEQAIFLHMNWHLYKWSQIQKLVEAKERPATKLQIENAQRHRSVAMHAREQISLFNLGLVFASCKKYDQFKKADNITSQEKWTEALAALLRSIDKFSADRGFKFSTYFFQASFKAIGRFSQKEKRISGQFITASRLVSDTDLNVDHPLEEGSRHLVQRETLDERFAGLDPRAIDLVFKVLMDEPEGENRNSKYLTAVEKAAFFLRYGSEEKMTLEEIGTVLGNSFRGEPLTKERARQASIGAINKIRSRIEEMYPGSLPSFDD